MIFWVFAFIVLWSMIIVGIASWQYMYVSSGENWHAIKIILSAGIIAFFSLLILALITLF